MKNRFLPITHFSMSLMLLFFLVILSSCRREGCIDPDSITFDDRAKKDDGSCVYEGSVVFWYNQFAANQLLADGAVALNYYVNGQFVGSQAASTYWTAPGPNCDQEASITVNRNLGSNKQVAVAYEVRDQDNFLYWSGIVEFDGNICAAIQLLW